ncbi:MAG: 6-bladed beta-propeller [Thaumarchaeota archaeon]|nr:6-bladed beta-propeller [Nitrososphaerota archaeon]
MYNMLIPKTNKENILAFSITGIVLFGLFFSPSNASAQTSNTCINANPLTDCGDLNFHNGAILQNAKNFIIFWEPSSTNPSTGKPYSYDDQSIDPTAANPSDTNYENLIMRYFKDVCGSSYYQNLLVQYSGYNKISGNSASTGPCSFGGFIVDTSPYPASSYGTKGTANNPLLEGDIKDEVKKFICHDCGTHKWDIGEGQNDFFVYLPNDVHLCSGVQIIIKIYTGCSPGTTTPPIGVGPNSPWCGFHDSFGTGFLGSETAGSVPVPFAVVLDDGGDASGCISDNSLSPNTDLLADWAIETTTHEQFESVTDPYPGAFGMGIQDGWHHDVSDDIIAGYSHEIGDECNNLNKVAWFGNDPYIVQTEWDNMNHGCDIGGNPTTSTTLASINCIPVNPDQNGNLDLSAGNSGTITCTITPQNQFSGTVTLTKGETILNPLSLDTTKVHVSSCSQPCTPVAATVHLTVTPYTPLWYDVTLNGYAATTDGSGVASVRSNVVRVNVLSSSEGWAAEPQPPAILPQIKFLKSWNSYDVLNNNYPFGGGENENMQFNNPTGITTDLFGNVYVADTNNDNVVEFDGDGNEIKYLHSYSYIPSGGYPDSPTKVVFSHPISVAWEPSSNNLLGNILVLDQGCVKKFDSSGNIFLSNVNYVTDLSGKKYPSGNPCVGGGRNFYFGLTGISFDVPEGMGVDSRGNIYVVSKWHSSIGELNENGQPIASGLTNDTSSGDAMNPSYTFGLNSTGQYQNLLTGIAVDSSGNIYTDYTNSIKRGSFFQYPACTVSDLLIHSITYTDSLCTYLSFGNGKWAPFVDLPQGHLICTGYPVRISCNVQSHPHIYSGIALDSNNNYVYIVDNANDDILMFDTQGDFITSWGSQGSGEGQFNNPTGIAVDKFGSVYVSDTGNNRVEKFSLLHGHCQSCIGTNSISSLAITGKINNYSYTSQAIPSWIKNTAGWWSQGQVSDDEFIKSLQYLIDNKIMTIPKTTTNTVTTGQTTNVPSWIKNTAGMWATGKISDQEFLSSVQYMISKEIIKTTETISPDS